MKKFLTVCIVHQGNKVLLGYKKRGFGMGRWNGFGGKVLPQETIEAAAVRETFEEAHIQPTHLHKLGVLEFSFYNQPDISQVHIFKATEFDGEVGESEEMLPRWFTTEEIPYDEMWKDDKFWFTYFLQNKMFTGNFAFNEDDEIVKYELKEVSELP